MKIVLFRCLQLLAFAAVLVGFSADGATVLVLQFHNESEYPDLNWVGESVAETLMTEFGSDNQIVLGRSTRLEALRELSLRPGADFTKASMLKIGQTLDADYVCYGSYTVKLAPNSTQLKDSSIQISAQFIDLRKLHEGPEFLEAGPLADLSRLSEHLAWQSLRYLDPQSNLPVERFLTSQKLIRLDAEESYIRGLMSSDKNQQKKWFTQAVLLDAQFTGPAYELGDLALDGKDYRQAIVWFERIVPGDPRYFAARFKMGLAAYNAQSYTEAARYFHEVAQAVPLNEVYNNLGATELELGQQTAMDDFRRALEGDKNDPVYLFNMGVALLKSSDFTGAARNFQAVLDHDPGDVEAQSLLDRAKSGQSAPVASKPPSLRLKENFDETAFRQLKAMLQPKAGR